MTTPLGIAVVGAGYWGPNLIRNFRADPAWDLRWVCDQDVARARAVAPDIAATPDLAEVLADPAVDAVAIATPARTHGPIALQAIAAGRHLLIEKPLASSLDEGEAIVAAAAAADVTLMCDHTYCYTPVVDRMRAMVRSGELGNVHYVDTVRVNLGLVQPDVDVFWDLAPHDLSILDVILPGGLRPTAVAAFGADPLGVGRSCMGYLVLSLADGGIAHVHVNWMSPTKVRSVVVGGAQRTLVWDDLDPSQRLRSFDRGIDLIDLSSADARRDALVRYRSGDMIAPALPEREALAGVVREFASAIAERRAAHTDGAAGLRVLRILDAVSRSLAAGGASVALEAVEPLAVSA